MKRVIETEAHVMILCKLIRVFQLCFLFSFQKMNRNHWLESKLEVGVSNNKYWAV